MMEGAYESTFQFLLSVFIVLSRKDRVPSNVQLASLVASLLTLVKYQIEQYLLKKHVTDLPIMEKIPKAVVLFPMFFTNNIFKLGSLAVACTLLRYWAIVVLPVTFWTTTWTLRCISRRQGKNSMFIGAVNCNHAYCNHAYSLITHTRIFRGVTHYLTPKETMENFLYNNILWFIIYPIMLTINVTMASIQEIWQGPEYSKNILVHNLGHLWVIYASILLSGIISSILIYFQIWRPYKEEEKANSQVICFC